MSKSILLTGLILGNETEMCPCTNINYRWLFQRPSDLLWMDKIIVTQNEWIEMMRDRSGESKGNQLAIEKAVKLVFEKLDTEGLIQIVPDTIISQSRAELILQSIMSDLELIEDLYKESDNENDPLMRMGQYEFCVPSLWSLYAAIELSMNLGASFSLEEDELAYLAALFPRKFNKEIQAGRNIAMYEVLSLYLPSVELGHDYLTGSSIGKCNNCVHLGKCEKEYLSDIEKQMNRIIDMRQYDEIRLTCEIMDKICDKSIETGHVLTGEELWSDLEEEAVRVGKRIRKMLPKVRLWRRISTMVSIGLGAASFINPIIGASVAVPAIAEHLLASSEEKMKKETSWVNFVNNPESVLGRVR